MDGICSNFPRIPLLRVENKVQRQCFSHYEIDKFYYLPKPALKIISYCQELSRERLLQRDEMMCLLNSIRIRIDLRQKFNSWKGYTFVLQKHQNNILNKLFKKWYQLMLEKKILAKFRKVYLFRKLKYFKLWYEMYEINRFSYQYKLKLKYKYFHHLLNFMKNSKNNLLSKYQIIYFNKLKYYFHFWYKSSNKSIEIDNNNCLLFQHHKLNYYFHVWKNNIQYKILLRNKLLSVNVIINNKILLLYLTKWKSVLLVNNNTNSIPLKILSSNNNNNNIMKSSNLQCKCM